MTAAKRFNICFDATRLRARQQFELPTGIDRVDLAYLKALLRAAQVDLQLVARGPLGLRVLKPKAARQLIETVTQRWQPSVQAEQARYTALKHWLEAPALTPRPTWPATDAPKARGRTGETLSVSAEGPLRSTAPGLYINTSHGQLYRPAYARWLQRQQRKGLFFVHDLIPIEYPEYSRAAEPRRHAARLATMAAHAGCVLVNSQATQAALRRYWDLLKVQAPPIEVAPLGISLDVSQQALPTPQAAVPYFVMVGTIEPRKNHALLLALWRQLVEDDPIGAPRLVLVGRRGWENETVFNLLDRAPALTSHVLEYAGLDDAGLLALLRGARALLNPSFAEGFGLPLAEALAAGVPVLASSLPAHREVGGNSADYLDPLDGLGWLAAIREFAPQPSPRRAAALTRVAGYRPATWESHFHIVSAQISALLA